MKKSIRAFALFLAILALACSFGSCTSKKVPTPKEFVSYTMEEELEFAGNTDAKALLDKWGEPQIVNRQRIWTVDVDGKTKYISAWFDGDRVTSVHASDILYVTVVAEKNNVVYCLADWNDYTDDPGKLTFMPDSDCFGNPIPCEAGDRFVFEFDGMIMESYPAQLHAPYSAARTDRLTDGELQALADLIVWP